METIQQTSFSIIALAGDAQEMILKALSVARSGDYAQSENLMAEAEGILIKAHRLQTDLIKKEADGEKSEFSVLLVHAQDYVMNAILAKKLVGEMILLYKEIKK